MISLTVPGVPQGKQRPRWSKRGTYTPKKTVIYETYIKELFVIKYPDFQPMCEPIKVLLNVYVNIPKSASNKKKLLMKNGVLCPVKRPDLDNVIKIFCDALQSVAYMNDTQIVEIRAIKRYSDRPRVFLRIYDRLESPDLL